jgi:hypothetical protein
VNTKADLGPCGKIHDENLKEKFEAERGSRPNLASAYEDEFLKFCHEMIAEVEKKIRKGKERLALAASKSSEADKRVSFSCRGDREGPGSSPGAGVPFFSPLHSSYLFCCLSSHTWGQFLG